ncbi:MAG: DUF4189 domain-containing protein [Wenzhouxiangella sp.]|nr:DUF4189 domain-containing protein [Wenzhouxiangella sp.]
MFKTNFLAVILATLLAGLGSIGAMGEALAMGALAIDGNQGRAFGFSYNQPDRATARDVALRECGRGCYVVRDFSSGCAAYAADQSSGSTIYGWGTATTSVSAQNVAMDYCRRHGGSRCVVRAWACNSR